MCVLRRKRWPDRIQREKDLQKMQRGNPKQIATSMTLREFPGSFFRLSTSETGRAVQLIFPALHKRNAKKSRKAKNVSRFQNCFHKRKNGHISDVDARFGCGWENGSRLRDEEFFATKKTGGKMTPTNETRRVKMRGGSAAVSHVGAWFRMWKWQYWVPFEIYRNEIIKSI